MYLRDKLTLHEISRRTGLSRNTLRKWVRVPEESVAPPLYQREQKPTRLSPYHAVLQQALKADAPRIKQNRRSAKALFAQITTSDYAGSYSRVTDFIGDWRATGVRRRMHSCRCPSSWVIGGNYRRIQVSHLKLCAGRAFWLAAYPSQGHEMLFDAHTRSFAALGGVRRRGIYDNMKTAVDKVNKGKGRIVNARFASMCSHYLFDIVETGHEAFRFQQSSMDAKGRINAREQRCKGGKAATPEEPF